jgi:hypothetical protein
MVVLVVRRRGDQRSEFVHEHDAPQDEDKGCGRAEIWRVKN